MNVNTNRIKFSDDIIKQIFKRLPTPDQQNKAYKRHLRKLKSRISKSVKVNTLNTFFLKENKYGPLFSYVNENKSYHYYIMNYCQILTNCFRIKLRISKS